MEDLHIKLVDALQQVLLNEGERSFRSMPIFTGIYSIAYLRVTEMFVFQLHSPTHGPILEIIKCRHREDEFYKSVYKFFTDYIYEKGPPSEFRSMFLALPLYEIGHGCGAYEYRCKCMNMQPRLATSTRTAEAVMERAVDVLQRVEKLLTDNGR
jgi:hypothetical protein